ncbi:hypothetical protein BU14_0471s0003 [Porphyra umbilicalis]|uniref:Uncharacterized protein n=1 Tax=Porphyra umbilicalis TaxID=2786 RepID=A0A1X6NTY3_PORUM|nr:hypothetical protein BU14_0471s0003 [Porphyra umbilicalis]|eukprot:OSX72064.1 hypothetical protein BU14_0471s0003 [Porphyra umbilicalis]
MLATAAAGAVLPVTIVVEVPADVAGDAAARDWSAAYLLSVTGGGGELRAPHGGPDANVSAATGEWMSPLLPPSWAERTVARPSIVRRLLGAVDGGCRTRFGNGRLHGRGQGGGGAGGRRATRAVCPRKCIAMVAAPLPPPPPPPPPRSSRRF